MNKGNPDRGELTFDVAGETRTLRFGTQQIRVIEAAFDNASIMDIVGRLERLHVSTLHQILMLAADLKEDEADEAIDKLTVIGTIELVQKAVALAFPQLQVGNTARPPKGSRAGTGNPSS